MVKVKFGGWTSFLKILLQRWTSLLRVLCQLLQLLMAWSCLFLEYSSPSLSFPLSPPCCPSKLGSAFYISISQTFLITDPSVFKK